LSGWNCSSKAPPRGGSLNAAGWTRCFLAFFRAYPNLIYRDIVRIDKVVMDFETAERYGFLIAVEAIIQTQELNVESPTYNERVQLQQWMMAGTFPTAGDAQHAARCDALLEAARDRCSSHVGWLRLPLDAQLSESPNQLRRQQPPALHQPRSRHRSALLPY
jgi:hypothetical protein